MTVLGVEDVRRRWVLANDDRAVNVINI
jgi:hypothetical protein